MIRRLACATSTLAPLFGLAAIISACEAIVGIDDTVATTAVGGEESTGSSASSSETGGGVTGITGGHTGSDGGTGSSQSDGSSSASGTTASTTGTGTGTGTTSASATTAGTTGRGTTGTSSIDAGSSGGPPCSGCALKVQYQNGATEASSNQIAGKLHIISTGTASIPLSAVTVRYWLSDPSAATIQLRCDYWGGGDRSAIMAHVISTSGTQSAIELSFSAGAGMLAPMTDAGELQFGMYRPDFTSMDQSDDYSFDPALTALADDDHITAYIDGKLVWGVEPPR